MLLEPAQADESGSDHGGLEVVSTAREVLDFGSGAGDALLDAPFDLGGIGHLIKAS
jgi:hypothetical protein